MGGEEERKKKSVQNEYNIVSIGCKPPPSVFSSLLMRKRRVVYAEEPEFDSKFQKERNNKEKLCLIQTEDKAQNKWNCGQKAIEVD